MAFRIPGETVGEARFQQRMERARKAQEEREKRRHEQVIRQIAAREQRERNRQWRERAVFGMFLMADMLLDRLTEMRDRNEPKVPDEPWNEAFCQAIGAIPEAKRFLEEMSIEMIDTKGSE